LKGTHRSAVSEFAASLNYRDHAIAAGNYIGGALQRDTVPLSDGAGEHLGKVVIAVS